MPGKTVWVRDPDRADDEVFVKGTVVSETSEAITVTFDAGQDTECTRAWPLSAILSCSGSDQPVKDHCNLDVLNPATVVENTRARYLADDIYTYISQLLIAVNPFKAIDGLYTEQTKERYHGCNWAQQPPHVYATAEMSYQAMIMHKQSQVSQRTSLPNANRTDYGPFPKGGMGHAVRHPQCLLSHLAPMLGSRFSYPVSRAPARRRRTSS